MHLALRQRAVTFLVSGEGFYTFQFHTVSGVEIKIDERSLRAFPFLSTSLAVTSPSACSSRMTSHDYPPRPGCSKHGLN